MKAIVRKSVISRFLLNDYVKYNGVLMMYDEWTEVPVKKKMEIDILTFLNVKHSQIIDCEGIENVEVYESINIKRLLFGVLRIMVFSSIIVYLSFDRFPILISVVVIASIYLKMHFIITTNLVWTKKKEE